MNTHTRLTTTVASRRLARVQTDLRNGKEIGLSDSEGGRGGCGLQVSLGLAPHRAHLEG